jgi:hypothetical protein
MTRQLQVLIQKKQAKVDMSNWRPSFIAMSRNSLTRLGPFDLLRWISHYYGFGSFIHFIKGLLTEETNIEAAAVLSKLIHQADVSGAGMYVDTIISPSFKTGVAQIVQIPGIAGMDNNSILFEFRKEDDQEIQDIREGCQFASVVGFNICILRSSDKHFGYRRNIHVWLNLMIILAYILIGHPDWKNAEVRLFATFFPDEIETKKKRLLNLVRKGQIPISPSNIQVHPLEPEERFDEFVSETSESADLVITGFSVEKMKQDKGEFLKGFGKIEDILFVQAGQEILITRDED